MERMGQVIRLKPEIIAEYKRIHAAVWPAVLKAIADSNIRNYSIFSQEPENLLFAYWEYHGTVAELQNNSDMVYCRNSMFIHLQPLSSFHRKNSAA